MLATCSRCSRGVYHRTPILSVRALRVAPAADLRGSPDRGSIRTNVYGTALAYARLRLRGQFPSYLLITL